MSWITLLKSLTGLQIFYMLHVAIIQVSGAGWTSGVCDEEVSGVSMEGEDDVMVVEEVGEGLCDLVSEIDE